MVADMPTKTCAADVVGEARGMTATRNPMEQAITDAAIRPKQIFMLFLSSPLIMSPLCQKSTYMTFLLTILSLGNIISLFFQT
jgi:hypothetical protein